ncbi:MAG: peroxiredoxin [Cyclobacteriaceae bacterium]|nr:peroxiredoxin [Cyclobacteriaceae bacterium]
MKITALTIVLLTGIAFTGFSQVQVGDKSPKFSAMDDSNNLWNSRDFVKKKIIVVYFYPAAMTGGCTKQACAFRDDKSKLDELGAMVIGVSGDEVENLKYFKEAHDLNFPLLADTDGSIAEKFGVPMKDGGSIVRNIGGSDITLERGVTSSRWTFIIDKKGKIVYINTEVNAANDSEQTIEVIQKL